jgi:hypothetical protein
MSGRDFEIMKYIEQQALKLFRIVHGSGDAGSNHAFWCQNSELQNGWVRLARHLERRIEKASEPIDTEINTYYKGTLKA